MSTPEEKICSNLPLPQNQPQSAPKLPPRLWTTAPSLRPGVWLTHAVADGNEEADAIAHAYRFRFPVTRLSPPAYESAIERGSCTFGTGKEGGQLKERSFRPAIADLNELASTWTLQKTDETFQDLQTGIRRYAERLAAASTMLRDNGLHEDAGSDFLIHLLAPNENGSMRLASWDGERLFTPWLKEVFGNFVLANYYNGSQGRPGLNRRKEIETGSSRKEDTHEKPVNEAWDDWEQDRALERQFEAHASMREKVKRLPAKLQAMAKLLIEGNQLNEIGDILDVSSTTLTKWKKQLKVELMPFISAGQMEAA